MKTLSDLTLKQLVAAYIGLTGIEVGPKFFNTKRAGIRRLEALVAEKNLTLADAFKAAGIETDEEPATAPTVADEPAGSNDAPQTPEADDAAPVAPLDAETAPMEEAPDAATILTSNRVINDTRDMLVRYLIDSAGLDPETAVLAALRAVIALKLPEPAPQPVTPRRASRAPAPNRKPSWRCCAGPRAPPSPRSPRRPATGNLTRFAAMPSPRLCRVRWFTFVSVPILRNFARHSLNSFLGVSSCPHGRRSSWSGFINVSTRY